MAERQLHVRVSADEHKALRIQAAEEDITLQQHVHRIIRTHLGDNQ